jgi:tetratricopeptide (TPR) repeat protein
MARGSVFTFKGKDVDPREAGQKLNVDAVVTGRVLQQGDTLVIRAEMMNVKDGSQVWGAEYDREFSDILRTQKEIAQEISGKLSTRLTGKDKERLQRVTTHNTEAYRLCLLAQYYAHKENQEGTQKSVDYYLRAIRLDPSYAAAYGGLANSYMYFPSIELASFREVGPKALDAATKALALDDSLAQPHVALGGYYRNKGDFKNAEREYKRALDLDPNFAEAHVYLAFVYALLGRHQEALAESKRAIDLDPLWVSNYAFDGLVLTVAGHYQRAFEQLQRAKEMDPSFCVTYVDIGQLYRQQGKFQEAIHELKRPEVQSTGCSGTWGMSELAYTYALAGKKEEAQKLLSQILEYSKRKFVSTNYIAIIYLGLGDKDQALYWLDKGYREESFWTGDMLLYLPVLRADPKFAGYLRRIHLS